MTDYYATMELDRTASPDDIKKSYKRLAMKYHPDRNPNNVEEATAKFKEINEAYSVLSDATKKDVYDRLGVDGLRNSNGGGSGTSTSFPFPFPFPFDGFDRAPPTKQSFRVEMGFSLRDLYKGISKRVKVTRNMLCSQCKGSGAKTTPATCAHCNGNGVITKGVAIGLGQIFQQQYECAHCRGTGIKDEAKCQTCVGKKIVRGESFVDVAVPKGCAVGHTLVFPKMADDIPGKETGDLIIVIVHSPSPDDRGFKLHPTQKGDLMLEKRLTLKQALCGYAFSMEHFDGRRVNVDTSGDPPVVPGTVKVLAGEGMSASHNLHVVFQVQFPSELSSELKKQLATILPA